MELLLTQTLAQQGFHDSRVLAAMMRVDRSRFVAPQFAAQAHEDVPLPIGAGQVISQPLVVATMTSALHVGEGARVLEIGTGSGYQAAVLAELGCEVFSIERIPELAEQAALNLARSGVRVHLRCGDGARGWPEDAPFDGVIVTAAAMQVPKRLLAQLAPAGHLVMPLGGPDAQELTVLTNTGSGFLRETLMPVVFVPLVSMQ